MLGKFGNIAQLLRKKACRLAVHVMKSVRAADQMGHDRASILQYVVYLRSKSDPARVQFRWSLRVPE